MYNKTGHSQPAQTMKTQIQPLIYTQRIFWNQFNDNEKLERLLTFLAAHRHLCDTISFFTESDGADYRFVPIDEVTRRAQWLTEVVRRTRDAGFEPEINILNTLGHSDDGDSSMPGVPWQGMVGLDGAVSRVCSCPSNPQFLNYVQKKYELYARCGAERIWIDDDVRFAWHAPVEWGCFCSSCLEDLSSRLGQKLTREQVCECFATDLDFRSAWVAQTREAARKLMEVCVLGVCTGSAEAEIGLMTINPLALTNAISNVADWMPLLKPEKRKHAWLRPGGGYWNDDNPRDILPKIAAVGQTVAKIPSYTKAMYEVENYPFMTGAKSSHATGMECLLVTCFTTINGIMFDVLDQVGNDLVHHKPWFERLGDWRELWQKAADAVAGTIPAGWCPAYSPRHFERLDDFPSIEEPLALQRAGIPVTPYTEHAAGHILCGSTAAGMNATELEALLAKPLILDGAAAARYIDLGLGDRIGIESAVPRTGGVIETFVDHPLNEGLVGFKRGLTLMYFDETSWVLEPKDTTITLSHTQEVVTDKVLGAAMTLFEGGLAPVVVLGHLPWKHLLSPARVTQLRRVIQYISAQSMPDLEGDLNVVMCPRKHPSKDQWTISLWNASMDPATVTLQDTSLSLALAFSTEGVSVQTNVANVELRLPPWALAVMQSK